RRQQRRGYTAEQLAEGEVDKVDEVAVQELPRQGLWVDVEV
ncbi:MAG: aspartate-semialdehyde dehydrogenase, partial [Pseudomonas sp.]